MFSFVNSIILTITQALIASLFVQLVVTSMQQIFGVWVTLYSPQHNEVYEINAFYAEMLTFLFLMVT